jgi:hypothetical protein
MSDYLSAWRNTLRNSAQKSYVSLLHTGGTRNSIASFAPKWKALV